jgi:nickel transport protein
MTCFSGSLLAHGLNLFVAVEGDLIRGKASFGSGHAADGVVIKITDEDGQQVAEINTDHDGSFSYKVVSREDYLITADSRDGHVIKRWVQAEMLSDHLHEPGIEAHDHDHASDQHMIGDDEMAAFRLEQVVARQITPLREEIAAYQAQVRLRDILGGLGYIIGLAGLALWFKGRRES